MPGRIVHLNEPNIPAPAPDDQLARLEQTLSHAEDLIQQFAATADSLRRQINVLKNGRSIPKKKIRDWSFTETW